MKQLLFFILISNALTAQNYYGSHFMVGLTVGATVTSLERYPKDEKAALMGILVGTGFGMLKEVTDEMRGSKFNTTDVWYTMFGSMVGSVVMYHLRKSNILKKQNRRKCKTYL